MYAAVFETLGTDAVAFRIAAWISVCGTAIAVWAIARLWRPQPASAIASLIFVVVSGAPHLEGYTANAEMFMMLPSAWSVWTLIKAMEAHWSASWILLTGVLIGVATMLKPSGIVMLPVAVVTILAVTRWQGRRAWLMPVLWLLGGLAIVGVPALIHGWFLGWSNYIYATITYRLTMQNSATVGITHHLAALGRLIQRILPLLILVATVTVVAHRRDIISGLRKALRAIPPRQIHSIAGCIRHALHRAWQPSFEKHLDVPDDRVGMILRLWLLASIAGIAMGGDW